MEGRISIVSAFHLRSWQTSAGRQLSHFGSLGCCSYDSYFPYNNLFPSLSSSAAVKYSTLLSLFFFKFLKVYCHLSLKGKEKDLQSLRSFFIWAAIAARAGPIQVCLMGGTGIPVKYLSHHCCFPGCTLAGNWIYNWSSDWDPGNLIRDAATSPSNGVSATPNIHPMFLNFSRRRQTEYLSTLCPLSRTLSPEAPTIMDIQSSRSIWCGFYSHFSGLVI